MPVLNQIISTTEATLPALRRREAELVVAAAAAKPVVDFVKALRRDTVALIAEVKRRSPSAGAIQPGLDPVTLAGHYLAGGAAAVSVLTDTPFFGGSLADLEAVSGTISIPTIRKDFILDPVQILEARANGASAVLLIVRVLEQPSLRALLHETQTLGMEALVEVHTESEIDRALEAGANVIGVNSRDLDSFTIDTSAAWRLLGRVPATKIAVAESGMATQQDVQAAAAAGADAVLIGGALAAAADPRLLAAALSGVPRVGR